MPFYGHRRIAPTSVSTPSLASSCQSASLHSSPFAPSSLSKPLPQSAAAPSLSLSSSSSANASHQGGAPGVKTERKFGLLTGAPSGSAPLASASRKFVPNLSTLHRAHTTASASGELGGGDRKSKKEEGVKKEIGALSGEGRKKSDLSALLLRSLDNTLLKTATVSPTERWLDFPLGAPCPEHTWRTVV